MSLLLTTCQDCIGAAHVLKVNETSMPTEFLSRINQLNYPQSKNFTSERCMICMEDFANDEVLYHKNCTQKLFGIPYAPIIEVSMIDLEELALYQINQRLTLTGVQKKLSLSPVKEGKQERLTVLGLDGRFILKPPTAEYPEMIEIEHLSMKLAQLRVRDKMLDSFFEAEELIERSFLSDIKKEEYVNLLRQRSKRMSLPS